MFPTLQDLLRLGPAASTPTRRSSRSGMAAAGIVFLIESAPPRAPTRASRTSCSARSSAPRSSRASARGRSTSIPAGTSSLFEQLAYGNASMLSAPRRRVARRARREAHRALPAAHRRPVRAGRRARDGDRPDRMLLHREARHADGRDVGHRPGCRMPRPASGAPAGVPLHPSFLYEIAFHAAAFAVLWFWLRHRPIAAGETLTLYIAAYAHLPLLRRVRPRQRRRLDGPDPAAAVPARDDPAAARAHRRGRVARRVRRNPERMTVRGQVA